MLSLNRKMKMKVKNIRLCKEKLDIHKQNLIIIRSITKVFLSKIRLQKSQRSFKRAIMMKTNKRMILLPNKCMIRMTKRKKSKIIFKKLMSII